MKRKSKKSSFTSLFEKVAAKVTHACGSPGAVMISCGAIILWAVTGPLFNFSSNWQLVINTGTTIVTFIMVFIIQHSQNKDTTAMQLKLNELIAANELASNRVVNIEDLTEAELLALKKFYTHLSKLAEKESDIFGSHSVDEANDNHNRKLKVKK